MFDSSYSYRFIHKSKPITKDTYLWEYKYSFTCNKNHRYIVNVEEYKYDVFAVKFHLKAHSNSNYKYQLTVKNNYAPRILGTIVEIMLSIYQNNPKASFCYIGAASLDETQTITKRARIYRYMMVNLFSEVNFAHFPYSKYNAYLLVSKNNDTPKLVAKIEAMFLNMYDFENIF